MLLYLAATKHDSALGCSNSHCVMLIAVGAGKKAATVYSCVNSGHTA